MARTAQKPAPAAEEEKPARLADEAETAEYIADLLTELERLARTRGLVRLQYRIMEAREEAQKAAAA